MPIRNDLRRLAELRCDRPGASSVSIEEFKGDWTDPVRRACLESLQVAQGPGQNAVEDSELHERVSAIIELMRPTIQADGGDLELVEISSEGDVTVRFHGACVGCPSSTLTLKAGIERNLKAHVPGVRSVSALDS